MGFLMSTYFVIKGSPDGGCSCENLDKETILARLSVGYYGEQGVKCLGELPKDICNFEDLIIILGTIVVPKSKEVVKSFEL